MKYIILSSVIALSSLMPICAFEHSVKNAILITQQAYLKASDASAGSSFGYSVAVSGNTAVVGAYYHDRFKGAVYVFIRNGSGWTQQQKLTASNAGAGDEFGSSVAITGETIVVGAPYEDGGSDGVNDNQGNGATDAGAAYVFTRSGSTWSQQAYLKASNSDGGDEFGVSVAIAGETIVVGANSEDSGSDGVNGNQGNGANDAGAAYVFSRSGAAWSQQAYLKASNSDGGSDSFDRGDYFGHSVAIAGDTIVVGAYLEDSGSDGVNGVQTDNGVSNAGAAYVFTRSGGTWSQQAYLKASNSQAFDGFGVSVAIADKTIVVGADGEDGDSDGVDGNQGNGAIDAGAAYVFTRSGSIWSQQAYIKASNSEASDLFGYSVAIAGEAIVVGAIYEASGSDGVNGNQSDNSAINAGAGYVFTRSGGTWSQQAYLKASNSDAGDEFGASVAMSGETVIVGAFLEGSITSGVNTVPNRANTATASGAAYVFTFPASSQSAVKVKFNTKLGNVIGAGSYTQGSSVTLTAKAKKGKKFLGWYEGKKLLSKRKNLTLTNLTKNRNLIAKFK